MSSAAKTPITERLRRGRHERVWVLGNKALLESPLIGLFCSRKCPGDVILKACDLIRELSHQNVTVISGFHSPVEKEARDILLEGKASIVVCLAKRLTSRAVSSRLAPAFRSDRVLIVSVSSPEELVTTAPASRMRNTFVADLADVLFAPYAASNSQTEQLFLDAHRRVVTVESPSNEEMLSKHPQVDVAKSLKSLIEMSARGAR